MIKSCKKVLEETLSRGKCMLVKLIGGLGSYSAFWKL
jgi:hypothetical protein